MPHVNRRIPDLGHNKLGTEEWDTDYVVKKGATDPFKIRKHANADLQSLLNMPAIAPLKFPFQMGWQGIETLLPKKKQYTTIELNTAKEGDFSATLEDSKEATREARLNQAKENVLPGTGSRYNKDGSKRVLGVLEQPNEENLTKKVAEISSKAPTEPDFTTFEKAGRKQAAGKGSVAKNKAMLKQWKWENQQHSVNGLVNNQPNNTSQETDTDYTEGPEADPKNADRFGYNESLKGVEAVYDPEQGKMVIPGQDKFEDPNALKTDTAKTGPGVGDFAMVALNMLENQQKQKQQKEQADLVAARSVTGAGAGRTDKLSLPTDELGWYNYFWG